MLASPHSGIFDATLALMAHHEWVVIMVATGGVLTLATHPETIGNNALFDRLGYDDACVLFDTAPARYLAACIFPIVCYFCLLHVHFKLARISKSDEAHLLNLSAAERAFIYTSNIGFAVAQCSFIIVFMIPP